MASLPLSKLAGLLIKTAAKPLSRKIKHEFSRFEATQNVLINVGQLIHQVESRFTVWSAGFKIKSIKPLESDAALKNGAEFIGESFVFLVAGGVAIVEYKISKRREKEKEAKRMQEMEKENFLLDKKLDALDARLKALEKVVVQNRMEFLHANSKKHQTKENNAEIHRRPFWAFWNHPT